MQRLQQGLLAFQQDASKELLENDGLSVFGRGLGMCTVAAALLAVHHHTSQGGGSGGAVIMIGEVLTGDENSCIPYSMPCVVSAAFYSLLSVQVRHLLSGNTSPQSSSAWRLPRRLSRMSQQPW